MLRLVFGMAWIVSLCVLVCGGQILLTRAQATEITTCITSCVTNDMCMAYGDTSCSGCDDVGGSGNECSQDVDVDYNPSESVIYTLTVGGNENATETGDVLCFRSQQCGEVATTWMSYCSGSAACQQAPIPMWCDICGTVGSVYNSIVTNQECSDCTE
jgi:hypothetical protein